MRVIRYQITDAVGIHARPAGMLAKEAKKYKSDIRIKIGDKTAAATKIMAVMSLGVKRGQTIEIEISGEDEEIAENGIRIFLEEHL